jgi:hypothetical protein
MPLRGVFYQDLVVGIWSSAIMLARRCGQKFLFAKLAGSTFEGA